MKVLGPLGSLSASGLFGGTIVFQKGKWGNKVYFKYPQKITRTPPQRVVRQDYSVCVGEWRIIREEEWIKFSTIGTKRGITGMNLFMQFWMTELYNARSGVGFCGGCMSGAIRTTPKINPYYMEDIRRSIYGQ